MSFAQEHFTTLNFFMETLILEKISQEIPLGQVVRFCFSYLRGWKEVSGRGGSCLFLIFCGQPFGYEGPGVALTVFGYAELTAPQVDSPNLGNFQPFFLQKSFLPYSISPLLLGPCTCVGPLDIVPEVTSSLMIFFYYVSFCSPLYPHWHVLLQCPSIGQHVQRCFLHFRYCLRFRISVQSCFIVPISLLGNLSPRVFICSYLSYL